MVLAQKCLLLTNHSSKLKIKLLMLLIFKMFYEIKLTYQYKTKIVKNNITLI